LKIFYYRKKQQFPNITGPHPIPVIGNALPLAFKPVHYALAEITRQWGSIFLMWLGAKPIIILNEPGTFWFSWLLIILELIKNVLQTNSASFRKGFFSDIVKPLMGDGLLTSEGEMWKLHHKLANSGFQVYSNNSSTQI
jgi:cytochrome P450